MKLQRSLIIGFISAAVALAAVLVLSNSAGQLPQRQRLAEGSFLQIASISYGTRHSFRIPKREPWKTFLVTYLPSAWTARLGWWANDGSVGAFSASGPPDLAVFTICNLATPTSFTGSPELLLCDEKGTKLDSAEEGSTAAGFDGKHDWKLVMWKLSKIPQNPNRLILRFTELPVDGKSRHAVAEFDIPNPRVNASKEINTEPLPQQQGK